MPSATFDILTPVSATTFCGELCHSFPCPHVYLRCSVLCFGLQLKRSEDVPARQSLRCGCSGTEPELLPPVTSTHEHRAILPHQSGMPGCPPAPSTDRHYALADVHLGWVGDGTGRDATAQLPKPVP